MKLRGFTLAEVLVTLGIIGVVAALTMPKINANVQRRELEASFAKIVRDLENTNQIIIGDKNAKTLRAACGITNADKDSIWNKAIKYYRTLANYYPITPGVNPAVTYSGGNQDLSIGANSGAYFTSKSREYGMRPTGGYSEGYWDDYAVLYIDINGPDKGPQRVGIDMHPFVLDLITGEVYGYGSRQCPVFRNNRTYDLSSTKCPTDGSSISDLNAITCAGSIMDNGGKILYNIDSIY